MKLTFLGTSHGYAEKKRYTSATLIEVNDLYYLLDAGAPVEWILVNTDKPFDKIRGIFITHMHNDHVGSLTSVIEPMLRFRYNDQAACFFPSEEGKDAFLNWSEALHAPKQKVLDTIAVGVTKEGIVFEENGIKVSARPTLHLGREKAFAYLFEANGKKALFTGDMSQNFPEYPAIIGNEHYDLVVCEMAHANLCDVQTMLQQTDTDRMIITHYFKDNMEHYETIFQSFPFPISLAYDGEKITL